MGLITNNITSPFGDVRKENMKETIVVYITFLVVALLVSNCGIFPEEETYRIDKSINDNTTAQNQQIEYWRTYAAN